MDDLDKKDLEDEDGFPLPKGKDILLPEDDLADADLDDTVESLDAKIDEELGEKDDPFNDDEEDEFAEEAGDDDRY